MPLRAGTEVAFAGPSFGPDVPSHFVGPRADFPHVLVAQGGRADEPEALAAAVRARLAALLHDQQVVVLRQLPLVRRADYVAFIAALGFAVDDYQRLFVDRAMGEGLYDVDTNPSSSLLAPHNENVFHPRQPEYIIFSCLRPASDGGETLLLRNATLTRHIDPAIIAGFAARGGVRYQRWYPTRAQLDATDSPGKAFMPTWQEFTRQDGRAGAEAYFAARGVRCAWDPGGGLLAWNISPAVKRNPRTGEDEWYNFATDTGGSPPFFRITYGDGTPIEPEVAMQVRTARFQEAVAVKLRAGDVICIPNKYVQHGRTPFTDAGRTLGVTLARGIAA